MNRKGSGNIIMRDAWLERESKGRGFSNLREVV